MEVTKVVSLCKTWCRKMQICPCILKLLLAIGVFLIWRSNTYIKHRKFFELVESSSPVPVLKPVRQFWWWVVHEEYSQNSDSNDKCIVPFAHGGLQRK